MTTALVEKFAITPPIQATLEQQKTLLVHWESDPVIINAVKTQNAQGPIVGMDNPKWKATRRTDPLITNFQTSAAGVFLQSKFAVGQGLYSEIFLNAAGGEKIAFVNKTSRYLHKGTPKFDLPFTTGGAWQGEPEFDESSQIYALQVAVPVKAEGTMIGVLVVGLSLAQLSKRAQ